ncbi:MAG: hypothetical protein KA265_11495 [Piscinibacter sp.]|nr:hypothetical protein [Piscinibacter sp.]MBP6636065.1 hypothetical protein [Sulfuritalea sp.]
MRVLIAIACAALLAACAANPKQNPVASAAKSGVIVAGTLSLGPCEMSVAPYYTRISVAAQKAHRRLDDGRMTVTQAEAVLKVGDVATAILDSVCAYERQGRMADAALQRETVARRIEKMEALIPETKR